jgi:hypothetical protein
MLGALAANGESRPDHGDKRGPVVTNDGGGKALWVGYRLQALKPTKLISDEAGHGCAVGNFDERRTVFVFVQSLRQSPARTARLQGGIHVGDRGC